MTLKTNFYLSFTFYHPKLHYYLQQFNTQTHLLKTKFPKDNKIILRSTESIWINQGYTEVLVKVANESRQYWFQIPIVREVTYYNCHNSTLGTVKIQTGTRRSEKTGWCVEMEYWRGHHKDISCSQLKTWWTHMIYSRLKKEFWELHHHWNIILNWNK